MTTHDNTNEYLMSTARKAIGSKGGKKCLERYGVGYYKNLSKKGVAARLEKLNKAKDAKRLADFEQWAKDNKPKGNEITTQ